jgi:hypothetical protein
MTDHRKTVTEAEAARSYVLHVLRDIRDSWPSLYKNLRKTSGGQFAVQDEPMAALDLALAVIAIETRTFDAHFPRDQSRRLRELILHYLNSPEYGIYAKEETAYFEKAMAASPARPERTVAKALLNQWQGASSPGAQGFSLLQTQIEDLLLAYGGVWKDSLEKFTLVHGD